MQAASEIKRRILQKLYRFYHDESSHGSMDTNELFRAAGADAEADFYEALRHLHDEDYVEGTPVPYERAGYLRTAKITKKGIDLIDDPSELDSLFPACEKSMAAAEFAQGVRLEIERADINREEKDTLLKSLQEFTANPAMLDALASALMKKQGR